MTPGNVVATYLYDPNGNQTSHTGSATTPLGYTGQYPDAETGFQYLRARYYDPVTGQFLTRDPAEVLTRSPYSYVSNNPVNGTDPTGLIGIPRLGDIGDALGGAADAVGGFVSDNRHTIIDIGTAIGAAS